LSPWLSCSSSSDHAEFEIADKLLKAGVGLHPGEEHYEKKGWFRLVFSVDAKTLEEGMRR
jgi:bifunctional pyridoxal-dependent enzyme with beta-cystathionase and maltose regulon repressor activities